MCDNTVLKEQRACGAMLGVAIGDAIGWPFERQGKVYQSHEDGNFFAWQMSGGLYNNRYTKRIEAGTYSDDTQLTIAVGRCLLFAEKWGQQFLKHELPAWMEYQQGGGGALKSVARGMLKNKYPWVPDNLNKYLQAGANGAAMRILPHVLYGPAKNQENTLDAVLQDVRRDAYLSHGHPRAIVGATCLASLLYDLWQRPLSDRVPYGGLFDRALALKEHWGALLPEWSFDGADLQQSLSVYKGKSYAECWQETVQEMVRYLQQCKKHLLVQSPFSLEDLMQHIGAIGRQNGSGTSSVAAAIYFASLEGRPTVHAVLKAAYCEGLDTDTVASMTGAITGMLFGEDWLSGWQGVHQVQDVAFLRDLALALVRHEPERVSAQVPALLYPGTVENMQKAKEPRWEARGCQTYFRASWGQTFAVYQSDADLRKKGVHHEQPVTPLGDTSDSQISLPLQQPSVVATTHLPQENKQSQQMTQHDFQQALQYFLAILQKDATWQRKQVGTLAKSISNPDTILYEALSEACAKASQHKA